MIMDLDTTTFWLYTLLAISSLILILDRLLFWNGDADSRALSQFKGPFLWRVSRLPLVFSMLRGNLPSDIKKLHDRYGHIVRIAPNEISFTASSAWKDIYGRRDFVRPSQMRVKLPGKTADSMCSADESDHTRFRRIFNPAFSANNVQQYEKVVQFYVDQLIDAFHKISLREVRHTNIVDWFNFFTFDTISELGWGISFRCIEKAEYHPYLTVINQFKASLFDSAARYYPFVHRLLEMVTPASARDALALVTSMAERHVRERLSYSVPDRKDILSYAIKARETSAHAISIEELETNSSVFMIAGSEPTTTALVGTLNCLLQHPNELSKLVHEVRSTFTTADEIVASSTANLPYLTAVLNEGLRMCPPVPDNLRRVVTSPGASIAGHFIPGGTVVSMPCWATFQSAENFSKPDTFWPERWLSESPPKGDNRAAFRPFSYGPANCLGQNLAWVEMRLVLCKILWNFDIKIPVGYRSINWATQRIWWSWDKTPLHVEFKCVRGT